MKNVKLKLSLAISFIFIVVNGFSQIQLSPIFTDNMVLQQQSEVPIWGKAKPNSTVNVTTSWDGKKQTTTADSEGKWMIKVSTPAAGGPFEIEINKIKLKNVLIGEVWICSGQSNMEWPVKSAANSDNEIAAANYPNIRLLTVNRATSIHPLEDFTAKGNGWETCSPETISDFSAVAYYFGRNIHHSLNVPVGLIHTSWGGTLAEAWTSEQSLKMMPEFIRAVDDFKTSSERLSLEDWLAEVNKNDFGLKDNVAIAAAKDYNDSDWNTAVQPELWENGDLFDTDGIVWFRKNIEIPESWEGSNLILSLGAIDDIDITYFNGKEIGSTNGWEEDRKYIIPASLVKKGTAVIAVRVVDTGGGGGFYGDPKKMFIAPVNNDAMRINLDGEWKYKLSVKLKGTNLNVENEPTSLFNAMLAPLIPYGIKGAIWYQGESNSGRSYQYRTLFPLMINDWRSKWGYDFPFYFVQLANYMEIKENPSESGWAELREAQLKTLQLENTGMAVTVDIGDTDDIHPKNKQDVGKRLALQALSQTYGLEVVASGPMYHYYQLEGDKIRIFFRPSKSALKIKGDNVLKGFAIAGPDKIFHWADARIEGDQVVVSSPKVAFPIAVRYAWADNPICNLFNEADLPASPFRTDDWR